MTGFDAFDCNTESEPPHRELRQVEQCIGTGKGHAIVRANGKWQAARAEQLFKGCARCIFACRLERFAQKQEARGMVGDGERVTIPSVAEPELTFEIGAPQIVTDGALR
jgi:hypothetical protein